VSKNSFNLGRLIKDPISAVEYISKMKNISVIATACTDIENCVVMGDKKRYIYTRLYEYVYIYICIYICICICIQCVCM
jgi:hypothetical protein